MTKPKQFTVAAEQSNTRLDIFLVAALGISRSQAQKMIDRNLVLVNDKLPKKAGDTMKEGYKIAVIARNEVTKQSLRSIGKDRHVVSPPWRAALLAMTPRVIAVTRDYIVIDKPSGLLTHPTMAGEKLSVASWAAKKYPAIKKVGDPAPLGVQGKLMNNVRPGIVHRLDKEASGLMVIARTQKMFNHLKEQFKNRTIEKEYFALVHDPVERNWDELNFPLARSNRSDRMAARPIKSSLEGGAGGVDQSLFESHTHLPPSREDSNGEKDARTEFFLEKQFVNFSLLRVIIHTGRMHQIRAHFLAYNHPLVGDPLYFQKKRKRTWDEKLGRLFLHSTKLSFTTLDGQKQTFESPLPAELENFLKQLA